VKLSDAAEQAFVRALAVDPKDRTQSIEAFWTQLEASLGRPPSLTLRRSAMDLDKEVAKIPSLTPEPLPPLAADTPPLALPAPAALPNLSPHSAPGSAASPRGAGLPQEMTPSSPFDDVGPGSFDVDMKRPAPSRPRTRPNDPVGLGLYQPPPVTTASMLERFRGPAWLVFFAVAIAVVDGILTRSGQTTMVGPIRPLWVAAGLGGLGVVLAILRAIDES
jgi:hypothetical protein